MNIQELIKVMHEWDMAPDGTLLREKPEGSTARHVFEKGVDATRRVWNEESTYTIEYRDGWQKWEGRAPFFDGNTEVECVLENRAVVRRKAKDMWRDVVVFRPVKPEPEVHYCAVYPNGENDMSKKLTKTQIDHIERRIRREVAELYRNLRNDFDLNATLSVGTLSNTK